MLELSPEEKDAILRIGSNSDHEMIGTDLLQELIEKGIMGHRVSDGRLDLTDLGETIYEQLAKESMS